MFRAFAIHNICVQAVKIVQHYLPDAHCFADDTQLYLNFKPLGNTAQGDAIQAMEKCIHAVRNDQ